MSQVESAALWEGRLSHRKQDEESEARRFNSLVLAGRLRSAVRNLTAREGGGVRAAGDVCTKTGDNIVSVLQAKFPPLRETNIGSEDCLAFEEYPRAPDPLDLIVGGDDREKVAGKLSGAAGIDCVDAADAQGYLVAHEGASALLRGVMADLTEWLANSSPPWAVCHGLTTRRLVALVKQPGTCPIGIGSIWLRCQSKLLIAEAKQEGTEMHGALYLCADLENGIKD